MACGRTLAKPGFPTISSIHHILIRKHAKIITATINLTTLATRLHGESTWQFQAIQRDKKMCPKKNLARQAFLGGRLFDLIEGGSAETSPVYRRRVKLNMAVAVSERSTWRVGAPSQSPVFPQYHRYIISSLESMRKSSPPQLT